MLLQAAAARWKVEAATLSTQPHKVVHPDGRTQGMASRRRGGAAGRARNAQAQVAAGVPADRHRQKRLDTPDKVAAATFGVDVRRPNMVYALVRHARALHGKVTKVTNLEAVRRCPACCPSRCLRPGWR